MAASDARRRIKNAIYRVHGQIVAVSTLLPITGGLTGMDAEISGDGGAFADIAASEAEVGVTGYFTCDLAATETAYDHVIFQFKATNAGAVTFIEHIDFEPALDSGVAQAGASGTITLRAAASATNDLYNGAVIEIVRGTGAGQIRTVTDYVGSTKVATVDRAWATNPSSDSVYIIHPKQGGTLGTDIVQQVNATQIASNAAAATLLAALYKGGAKAGNVNDASATTTVWIGDAGLSATDDFYNGQLLIFTSGANLGLASKVADYVGSTKTFTMTTAFPSAPANGDTFVLLGRIY